MVSFYGEKRMWDCLSYCCVHVLAVSSVRGVVCYCVLVAVYLPLYQSGLIDSV